MKILSAIFEFIVKFLAASFIWLIVAFVVSIPLGLILLKVSENLVGYDIETYDQINNNTGLVYTLFVVTCFIGVILARVVAVSIKTLADKKLADKPHRIISGQI